MPIVKIQNPRTFWNSLMLDLISDYSHTKNENISDEISLKVEYEF